jgi:hypothetical protein
MSITIVSEFSRRLELAALIASSNPIGCLDFARDHLIRPQPRQFAMNVIWNSYYQCNETMMMRRICAGMNLLEIL